MIISFSDKGLHRQPHAFLCNQFHRRFIDQLTVFDTFHPSPDSPADRLRHIDMHHHISTRILGGHYRRMQFIFEILHIFQLVIQRRDPSACHQLDLTRTQTQVIPRSDDHGIHPVGDDSSPDFLGMSQAATIERLRDIVYHTKIGMSACFGNNRPTRINTRSRQCSLIDRPFQSEYRSPRIPDRRKTPQKSLPGFLSGSQLCIRSMSGQQIDHRISSQISMPMCIDQSGHQKFSPPIDHFYFCSGNNRFGRYFPDRIVLDPYISRDGLFTFPVENHDILNQNSLSHSQ